MIRPVRRGDHVGALYPHGAARDLEPDEAVLSEPFCGRGAGLRITREQPKFVETPSTRTGGCRGGPLAGFEVLGSLHAEPEREAGEGLFRRVGAEPRPPLFGDPESALYPRLPLRRPRDEVVGFGEGALGFHDPMLAHDARPRPSEPGRERGRARALWNPDPSARPRGPRATRAVAFSPHGVRCCRPRARPLRS